MEDQLIEFETAKLAKEKGFDWECSMTAVEDTKHIYGTGNDNHNQYRNNVSIPTQSLLQKWLREEHGIIVLVEDECHPEIWVFNVKSKNVNNHYCEKSYKTYEEALEKALLEGLKLIK